MRNRWSAALAALVLVALGPTATAWGTTLVPMSDDDLVRTSALIVVGTVRRIESVAVRSGRIFTEVTLGVERRVKGRLRSGKVLITVPGGQVGDRFAQVFGAPEFKRGERVLVFLKRTPEGRLRTNALALGKYHLDTAPDGTTVARRTVPTEDVRHLDRFLADLNGFLPTDGGAQQPSGRVSMAARDVVGRSVTDNFTYLTGTPYRWFEDTVSFGVANSDSGLGQAATQSAITSAMAAWTNVASASIVIQTGAATTPAHSVAGGVCDGISSLQFDDPFSEVQDMTNCSGVLGVGGICGSSITMVAGGITFRRITEGDVTINQGFGACFGATNLAEVMTHEIGHAIGLGHSADADATMYAYAHFDGRGGSVHADDVLGAATIYPVASGTTTTTSSTSTTSRTTTSSSSTTSTSRTTSTSSSTTSVTTSSSTTVTQPAASSTTSTSSTSSSTRSTTTTSSSSSSSRTSSTATSSTATSSTESSSTAPVPTSTTTTVPPTFTTEIDGDGDGVIDVEDACPDTPSGEMIYTDGCSVCPCDAAPDGTAWTSHTAYLRCVKNEARDRFSAAEFSRNQARDAVRLAMVASCGRSGATRCCIPRVTHSQCKVVSAASCATQRTRAGSAEDVGPGSCLPNPCQ